MIDNTKIQAVNYSIDFCRKPKIHVDDNVIYTIFFDREGRFHYKQNKTKNIMLENTYSIIYHGDSIIAIDCYGKDIYKQAYRLSKSIIDNNITAYMKAKRIIETIDNVKEFSTSIFNEH